MGSRNCVSVFIDLRGAYKMLRDEEMSPPAYTVCQRHSKYGVLKNIEYSLGALGKAVKRMQENAIWLMAEELLCGANLRSEMEKEYRSLPDEEGRHVVGYWFLTDRPSDKFVKEGWSWSKKEVYLQIAGVRFVKWARDAPSLLVVLLTYLHITLGELRKGKEIASLGYGTRLK